MPFWCPFVPFSVPFFFFNFCGTLCACGTLLYFFGTFYSFLVPFFLYHFCTLYMVALGAFLFRFVCTSRRCMASHVSSVLPAHRDRFGRQKSSSIGLSGIHVVAVSKGDRTAARSLARELLLHGPINSRRGVDRDGRQWAVRASCRCDIFLRACACAQEACHLIGWFLSCFLNERTIIFIFGGLWRRQFCFALKTLFPLM